MPTTPQKSPLAIRTNANVLRSGHLRGREAIAFTMPTSDLTISHRFRAIQPERT